VSDIEEDLKVLDAKLKQLKLAYEQYFLGTRPREPVTLRREVDKQVVVYSNTAIQNTAMRFKFNSICSRYNAFRRQWNDVLRKIDQGTYERHIFKAKLHERTPGAAAAPRAGAEGATPDCPDLFDAYIEARRACGQDVASLSQAKLRAVLDKQAAALRGKLGGDVRFRVVVENGKAKLKAGRA
jgi:hypothetical protein